MVVKFADLCDGCGERSEDYTTWPSCEHCAAAVCLSCAVPGTWQSGEGDGPDTAVCTPCASRRPNPWEDDGNSDARELARDRWAD